jgi:glucose-1-phosphate thymidylyltransferase
LKVACPEEIAFRCKYITHEQLEKLARGYANNGYGQYLNKIAQEESTYLYKELVD